MESLGQTIRRSILFFVATGIWALLVNWVSPRGIPLVGFWPSGRDLEKLERPLAYQPTDAPLVNVLEASLLFQKPEVVFLDVREPVDFAKEHIPKAINLPFEEFDEYFPKVSGIVTPEKEIVVYCAGLDCDASLYACRLLQEKGYQKLHMFFGGWQKWKEAGMPVQKGQGLAIP